MQPISDDSRDYSFDDIEVEERFKRCRYEMVLTYSLWIVYATICIGLSYFLGRGGGENITYTFGVPTWIFWGILTPTGVFFLVVCYVSMFVFQDMDLFDAPDKN